MPVPILVSVPAPLKRPLNVVEALLLPTDSPRPVVSAREPLVPCKPPKVAAVSVPKLSVPMPLESKVLIKRAATLFNLSVPPLTIVLPMKLFEPEIVKVPPLDESFTVRPPLPELVKALMIVVL